MTPSPGIFYNLAEATITIGISAMNFGHTAPRVHQLVLLSLSITLSLLTGCATLPSASQQSWENTIARVSTGIVTIEIDSPVAFDGLNNFASQATGFVVDRERGIILTNRHVVTAGPVTARAVFLNNEEVELTPLYKDPVHDFGFYTYAPKELHYITPHEFSLAPSKALVGTDIRVIGNDSGQKISILDGTLSRLDAPAPYYGPWTYNDFNTFYIQAASNTSGGSSGSPVINASGEVVALNAGGNSNSASAFYLPLHRVVRALTLLRDTQPIARGSLQTTFASTPYPELQRLGLDEPTIAEFRRDYPDISGLLVVAHSLPQSPAAEVLNVGDIILAANGAPVTDFVTLETLLDNNVGESVSLTLSRQGNQQQTTVPVSDLHALTPNSFLEYDNGILHTLSYQQARHYNMPAKGVFAASVPAGFGQAGIPRAAVITHINGQPVDNLEAFADTIASLPDGEDIHLRYFSQGVAGQSRYAMASVNWDWQLYRYCREDPLLGFWPCSPFDGPGTRKTKPETPEVALKPKPYPVAAINRILPSLVQVAFNAPFSVNDISLQSSQTQYGTGMVVDASRGLVITDRNTVLTSLGEVTLIFNGTREVPATIEYLHPLHNLAVLRFDPARVSGLGIKSAPLTKQPVKKSEHLWQLGYSTDGELKYRQVTVEQQDALTLRPSGTVKFRDHNLDVIFLEESLKNLPGLLVDDNGRVAALWAGFEEVSQNRSRWHFLGIPAWHIDNLKRQFSSGTVYRSLELELSQMPARQAIKRGVSQPWLKAFQATGSFDNRFLEISKISSASPANQQLRRGDLILAVNDTPVTSFKTYEELTQVPELTLTLLRENTELTLTVKTLERDGDDLHHMLQWAGLRLQEVPPMAQLDYGVPGDGAWIVFYLWGSPAHRAGITAMQRIVEINGTPISSVEDLINATRDQQHGQVLRIKTIDVRNNTNVATLRLDRHYWPTLYMRKDGDEWVREYLDAFGEEQRSENK